MNRSFANLFYITPAENVVSVIGNNITFKTGYQFDTILTKNDLELSEEIKESGANDYYNQKSSPISHSIESNIRSKYRKTKVIVQLKTTEGELFTWGSIEVPVRVTLDSELNADKWKFTRSSPTPIIT